MDREGVSLDSALHMPPSLSEGSLAISLYPLPSRVSDLSPVCFVIASALRVHYVTSQDLSINLRYLGFDLTQ